MQITQLNLPRKHIFQYFDCHWLQSFTLILAITIGISYQFIDHRGVFVAICYAAIVWYQSTNIWQKAIQETLVIIGALALMLHVLPGFNNVPIWQQRLISPDALAHSFYINFDKALVSLILLPALLLKHTRKPVVSISFIGQVLVLIAMTFVVAYLLGVIEWQPKWSNDFIGYFASMMMITVVAEECLFRGRLQPLLSDKYGIWGVVVISGLLFGLVHLPFSTGFAIAAIFAGLAYGYSYYKTQNIFWPIGIHMLVNTIHLLFFTYPLKL